jgi:DNA-binding NtrC family response regulator
MRPDGEPPVARASGGERGIGARIFVVEHEPLLREFLAETQRRSGHEVICSAGDEEALRRISLDPPDLLLLDIRMQGCDGVTLLPEFRRLCPEAPVIMIAAPGTPELGVTAWRAGAFDYLVKPVSADTIDLVVERALSVGALRRENADLRHRLSLQEALAPMVGRSRVMDDLRWAIRLVAPTRSAVLIAGESGTGKELVARAIHEGSTRAGRPFIKVNCAAVPAGPLEIALFGHEGGAFTGAAGRAAGCLEQAHGGSLLLDEISEMDHALQPKILRALQEREFYRVGGSTTVRVDVRVLATTNADLRDRVRQGMFREDLFHHLAAVPLTVPPLRDRRDDVLLLAAHFLARFAEENGRSSVHLTPQAGEILVRYDWPGNVRELRNAVERAVILCSGSKLGPEHFILEPAWAPHGGAVADSLRARERAWILSVLKETGGNRTAAARRLDVSVRTIRNKLALYEREEARALDETLRPLRSA